ncbi:MAG: methyltransferase domain-containing protein [Methylovulum sp.]|nr:methyltransferase domain-containing protein [Methylovulum sp.]
MISEGHVHLGYWDASNPSSSYAAAAHKLTEIMIAKTHIQADQRFCDLGCGVGAPAMALAQAKQCYVDGITISSFQQASATARAQAQGMQGRTSFIADNVLTMPFDDNTYDGGWFFESIFHMGHREALHAAHRVLKPGAALLIADLTALPTITPEFTLFAKDQMYSAFIAKEAYPELLAETGFELLDITNISSHVMPFLVPKIKDTIDTYKAEILKHLDKQVIEETVMTFQYMADNLEYVLVSARKL